MKKLIVLALLGACAVIYFGYVEKHQQAPESKTETKAATPKTPARKEQAAQIRKEVNGATTLVDLSSIQGRKLGDLYTKFLGIPDGIVPKSAFIDFEKNLAHLWAGKVERKDSSDSTQANVNKVLAYYHENKTRMSLREYINLAGMEVAKTQVNIDWVKLCHIERLDENRCKILRAISKEIVGKDVIAYGMTEIFPTADGKLNVAFLDILLRQAGAEYVDSLPAIHDGYLSFGLYQFTSFAVFETNGEKRGVSKVNQAVNESARVPDSVIFLRNGDHHRAAYMFAVHNIATLLRLASKKEVDTLGKLHAKHPDEIVQFIAIAHHNPGGAIKGARRWIASGMKKELRVSLGKVLGKYATKTEGNLIALYGAIK